MPRFSRDKGKRGERELAEELRSHGLTARRGAQYQGGPDSPDVVCEELAKHVHFECKRAERLDLEGALLQAELDADGRIAVVAHRKNGREWCAILPLSHLIALVKRAYGLDNQDK
jgi:Holliday junction resolvase